jgi:hypothetical protein
MKSRAFRRYWVVVCVVFVAGCSSWEDKCETLLEYGDKCSDTSYSDDDVEDCGEDLEDASDDCQDAFDDLIECIDDNDSDCQDVQDECPGEAVDVLSQCEGEIR